MTDHDLMQQALDALITCEVQIESEWGVARSMEQIEADGDTLPVILALRERLAQPEQEPVAWMTPDGEGFRIRFSPPVNDVPLGWDALYTAPPQRKPLTDEQIDELSHTMVKGNKSANWLCRAIEAAHGVKGDR